MSDLQTIVEGGLQKLKAQVEQVAEDLQKKQALLQVQVIELAQKSVDGYHSPSMAGMPSTSSIKAAIGKALGSEGFKRFAEGNPTSGPIELGIDVKLLTSLQGNTGSDPAGVNVTRTDMGTGTQAFRPTRVLETLTQRTVTGNTVGFNRIDFASGVNDANYQDGEGEEKAEQDLLDAYIEAPVVTIAVHTTLSKQVLDDQLGLMMAVESLLRYGLAEKTDRELLNGIGGDRKINGLVTQAEAFVADSGTAPADRIGAASAYLQAEGYNPGVVFLNPQDWFAIASERTTDEEYVAAGWTAPASPTIYGLTAIATPSIAIGTALVMDPQVAMVGLRQNPTVEMSREHNGAFTKNLVTVLAELRLALLVMDAKGMVTVGLSG